jgi:hypothetical protein
LLSRPRWERSVTRLEPNLTPSRMQSRSTYPLSPGWRLDADSVEQRLDEPRRLFT